MDDSVGLILRAIRFSAEKHNDQRRKDAKSSPYINHPIEVAETLWRVGEVRDEALLVAAILHDTVEDTDTTKEEIETEFGKEVLKLVLEVTDKKTCPNRSENNYRLSTRHTKANRRNCSRSRTRSTIFVTLSNPRRRIGHWTASRNISYGVNELWQVCAG